jgi:hypothetical protein
LIRGKCRATLAEADAGLTFDYELVVDHDVAFSQSVCSSEDSLSIDGPPQHDCAAGACLGKTLTSVLHAGVTTHSYRWDRHPCSTGPLPPGQYDIDIVANGIRLYDAGASEVARIAGRITLTLVP